MLLREQYSEYDIQDQKHSQARDELRIVKAATMWLQEISCKKSAFGDGSQIV